MTPVLDNAAIAELFVRQAEGASGNRETALREAANEAFMWPEEAAHVVASGRSLRELPGIGPTLARQVHRWLGDPPKVIC